MARRHYGTEPENSVQFNFDESGVSFLERALVKFFTTQTFCDIDKLCVRYVGESVQTKFTSLAKPDLPYQKTLYLQTVGSKTGRIRSCVLPYVMDEGRYCVAGTRAGGPIHPAWALNLRRNPSCWAWIDRKYTPCRAEEAQGEVRERVVNTIRDTYGTTIDEYTQTAHPRVIPIMMLSPCKQYV